MIVAASNSSGVAETEQGVTGIDTAGESDSGVFDKEVRAIFFKLGIVGDRDRSALASSMCSSGPATWLVKIFIPVLNCFCVGGVEMVRMNGHFL